MRILRRGDVDRRWRSRWLVIDNRGLAVRTLRISRRNREGISPVIEADAPSRKVGA